MRPPVGIEEPKINPDKDLYTIDLADTFFEGDANHMRWSYH